MGTLLLLDLIYSIINILSWWTNRLGIIIPLILVLFNLISTCWKLISSLDIHILRCWFKYIILITPKKSNLTSAILLLIFIIRFWGVSSVLSSRWRLTSRLLSVCCLIFFNYPILFLFVINSCHHLSIL